MEIQLSIQQEEIIGKIINWYKKRENKQYLTLGGYAGTGKTTIIGYISNILRKEFKGLDIAFCSYTGKAVRILSKKLLDSGTIFPGDTISTIHQLIYEPIEDDDGIVISWKRKDKEEFKYNLIVVDESSMINENIWNDLLSYDVPILAVGDHGQLPPIEGKLNLMQNPDLKLETIYRQEKDNPIILVSQMARERGIIPTIDFSPTVKKMSRTNPDTQEFLKDLFLGYDEDMLVLVGFNNTRVKLNRAIRGLLDFETDQPEVRDRVICLRNSYENKIYNGMTGVIKSIEDISDDWGKYYKAKIDFDDDSGHPYEGLISYDQFNNKETLHNERFNKVQLFDYGYALTVHKAQGSQSKKVVVFEERFSGMDNDIWKRWLYTAVTRASEELYIIG